MCDKVIEIKMEGYLGNIDSERLQGLITRLRPPYLTQNHQLHQYEKQP